MHFRNLVKTIKKRPVIAVVAAVVVAAVVVIAVVVWSRKKTSKKSSFEMFTSSPVCGGVYHRVIPGFLSDEQCDALTIAATRKGMVPSQVGGAFDETTYDESIRNSTQTWFGPGDHHVTDAIASKTKDLVSNTGCAGSLPISMEHIQVARYGPSGKYDAHYDGDPCGGPDEPACPTDQRFATLLVYLADDFEGGHTNFPLLGETVTPKKGTALFFWVADPASGELFEKTLHAGMPVTKGTKWIANQWIRRTS